MRHPFARPALIVLALALAGIAPRDVAAADDPRVLCELLNGVPRVVLEGSYSGCRYTVQRTGGADEPFQVIGQRDGLCTGDCFVLDPSALMGATYWYRFDVLGSDGVPRTYGPHAVTIGGREARGLSASPSPNPLRDRGTLRVTAAIPAGQRAGDPSRATGLPGEVTLVDMSGRVLRTLWSGTLDRLTFDVPFAAQDARGRTLPPGLYFVVVRAGSHRSISRVAVIR